MKRCKYCECTDNIMSYEFNDGYGVDLRMDVECGYVQFDLRVQEPNCGNYIVDHSIDINFCPFCGVDLRPLRIE